MSTSPQPSRWPSPPDAAEDDRVVSWVLLVVGALVALRLSTERWEAGMTLSLAVAALGLHGLWAAGRRGTLPP